MTERDEARRAAEAFAVDGQLVGLEPLVRGHINRTWISTWRDEGGAEHRYLHQRINEHVFGDVAGLMHNVEAVTRRLAEVEAATHYEALRLVWTRTGEHWLRADDGPWRTYHFVENTEAFDRCSGPDQAYEVARIFGWFQHGLEALDSNELVETIPGFFSPGLRLRQLDEAVAGAAAVSERTGRDRVAGVAKVAASLGDGGPCLGQRVGHGLAAPIAGHHRHRDDIVGSHGLVGELHRGPGSDRDRHLRSACPQHGHEQRRHQPRGLPCGPGTEAAMWGVGAVHHAGETITHPCTVPVASR